MPKIKNVSGVDRIVPQPGGGSRLVMAGQVIEVPTGETFSYTQQEPTWGPADEDATAEHDEMLAIIAALLGIEAKPEPTKTRSRKATEDDPAPEPGDNKPQEG